MLTGGQRGKERLNVVGQNIGKIVKNKMKRSFCGLMYGNGYFNVVCGFRYAITKTV